MTLRKRFKAIPTTIELEDFIAEEAKLKEGYVVNISYSSKAVKDNAEITVGGIGLALAVLPNGGVLVTGFNDNIIYSNEGILLFHQPSPVQVHGGISIGDMLVKVNQFQLTEMDLMQITDILGRLEYLSNVLLLTIVNLNQPSAELYCRAQLLWNLNMETVELQKQSLRKHVRLHMKEPTQNLLYINPKRASPIRRQTRI